MDLPYYVQKKRNELMIPFFLARVVSADPSSSMGRSPFFMDSVIPTPIKPDRSLRLEMLQIGQVIRIEDAICYRDLLRNGLFPMRMERECSSYGREECRFPHVSRDFRVAYRERYNFNNAHGCFEYVMLGFEDARDNTKSSYCTFEIREADGLVFNVESYTCRGEILSFSLQ